MRETRKDGGSTPIPTLPPSRGKGFQYGIDHAFQIVQHLLIAETQDAIALGLQPRIPSDVVQLPLRQVVPAAIHLDDETSLMDGEIDDIATDGGLATHMQASLPQGLPKRLFGKCHRTTKATSFFDRARSV